MAHPAYILGDLHLGAGRDSETGAWDALDRFRTDEALCAFLDAIGRPGSPVELVIAGDLIDYPRILPGLSASFPTERLGASEADSVERTLTVLGQRPRSTGHPLVFGRLRRLMEDGHSITLVVGERDVDLLWPEVWGLLFEAIYPPGAPGTLRRLPLAHVVGGAAFGRVYVEHGHEHDAACAFGDAMRHPFAQDMSGTWRLRRPWGLRLADALLAGGTEPWLLDVVRPAVRAVARALRQGVPLDAPTLALVVRRLLTSGAAPDQAAARPASEPSWPRARRTARALVQALADDELRGYLEGRMTDPAFLTLLDAELQGLGELEWSAIAAGVDRQPTLLEAEGGGLPLEEAQRAAAQAVLAADPAVGTVVMAHSHTAHDGRGERLPRGDGRAGYFFNTGAWTPQPPEGAPEGVLLDPAGWECRLPYLRCIPDMWGAYHVELRSWAAEQ